MTEQVSSTLEAVDSLLFQLAFKNQQLTLKKNDIDLKNKVCRADIAERMTYIETIERSIEKLEDEIRVKQSAMKCNKAKAQSMKNTNSLLLQYEQTLKAELENTKLSYKQDLGAYEERLLGYRKTLQLHKEYHLQNPLAQKLIMLLSEKDEIECRIKARDDQITFRQKEQDCLTGSTVNLSSSEEALDSAPGDQAATQQCDPHAEDDCCANSNDPSLNLIQTKIVQDIQETAAEVNADEIQEKNEVQDESASSEEACGQMWLSNDPNPSDKMLLEEHDQNLSPANQVSSTASSPVKNTNLTSGIGLDMEKQPGVLGLKEAEKEAMEEREAAEKDDAQGNKNNERPAVLCQSSEGTSVQSSPGIARANPETPTFQFNFSPGSYPHHGASDTKSPDFLFSLNTNPITPGFAGFDFDVGSQDEESSFLFTSSFFHEKKTMETKPGGPDFLFNQPERGEEFQFAFPSEPPQTTNTKDDFPFPFSF